MAVTVVRCKEIDGEIFVNIPDLKIVLENRCNELIKQVALLDHPSHDRLRRELASKTEEARGIQDALKKYEVQMKNA